MSAKADLDRRVLKLLRAAWTWIGPGSLDLAACASHPGPGSDLDRWIWELLRATLYLRRTWILVLIISILVLALVLIQVAVVSSCGGQLSGADELMWQPHRSSQPRHQVIHTSEKGGGPIRSI